MSATYGGANIFGLAVRCQHVPRASASQINSFFGVAGTQLVYGGTRGRSFLISGVLMGSDIPTLNAAEATLRSYDDGIARTLVDPRGQSWPNVVFRGEFQPDAMGPQLAAGGSVWCLAYKAVFIGLT